MSLLLGDTAHEANHQHQGTTVPDHRIASIKRVVQAGVGRFLCSFNVILLLRTGRSKREMERRPSTGMLEQFG